MPTRTPNLAEYRDIQAAVSKNKLNEALRLMNVFPDFQRYIPLLQRDLTKIKQEQIKGIENPSLVTKRDSLPTASSASSNLTSPPKNWNRPPPAPTGAAAITPASSPMPPPATCALPPTSGGGARNWRKSPPC